MKYCPGMLYIDLIKEQLQRKSGELYEKEGYPNFKRIRTSRIKGHSKYFYEEDIIIER